MTRALILAVVLAAGCGDDLTRSLDAALDSGPDDAAGKDAHVTCPAVACPQGQYCEVTSCGGSGICLPTPANCPLSFNPVCGCNHVTYQNDCNRKVAGIGLGGVGRCTETCNLTPRRSNCCFSDGDCGGATGTGQICEGELCEVGSEGRCVAPPASGACWFDSDCLAADGGTSVCQGAVLCPCGASCAAPDTPGTCGAPDGG